MTTGSIYDRLGVRPIINGRGPTTAESELAVEFVGDEESKAAFGRWEQLAQVLLMSNEFAFVD